MLQSGYDSDADASDDEVPGLIRRRFDSNGDAIDYDDLTDVEARVWEQQADPQVAKSNPIQDDLFDLPADPDFGQEEDEAPLTQDSDVMVDVPLIDTDAAPTLASISDALQDGTTQSPFADADDFIPVQAKRNRERYKGKKKKMEEPKRELSILEKVTGSVGSPCNLFGGVQQSSSSDSGGQSSAYSGSASTPNGESEQGSDSVKDFS